MTVIQWQHFLKEGLPVKEKLSSMTIGIFDGVHRGHQALIKRVVSHNGGGPALSQGINPPPFSYVPVVITFKQNHKNKKHSPGIQTFQEKAVMLESLGVEVLLVIDFTESFRRMSGIEFLEVLLRLGNIGFFAVGSSFRCGYRQDTDAPAIQSFFSSHSIPADIVPEVMEGSLPISSSRIRAAVAAGDFRLAEVMLGRKQHGS